MCIYASNYNCYKSLCVVKNTHDLGHTGYNTSLQIILLK